MYRDNLLSTYKTQVYYADIKINLRTLNLYTCKKKESGKVVVRVIVKRIIDFKAIYYPQLYVVCGVCTLTTICEEFKTCTSRW